MRINNILIGTITLLALIWSFPEGGRGDEISPPNKDSAIVQDSSVIQMQMENLDMLKAGLLSGKPTLAYFYYSVACSCTAARCAIASAAIDSIPQLNEKNNSLNVVAIDAYVLPETNSLFNVTIVPAVVYFDKDGKEINRLEWGTSREAILKLINHPDEKQEPLD
jgi:thiol-disulfide isomerase/thioredoxin